MRKQYKNLINISSIIFVIGFLFFGNINKIEAATRTWTGTTSGSWSVSTNWTEGAAPVTGDDLVFPNGASNLSNTNDLTENTIINSITFSGSGYTISGNPIILGPGLAGITDSVSSGGNTIALDMRFDATRDIIVTNTAESLTISGRIAGVGGLNKEGTGTLILSGENSYGGITKINVGVLNAQNSRSLGTILAGTEVVGGAALELQGNIDINYEALALRGYGVSGTGGALRNISGTNTFRGLITLSSAAGAEIASDSGTLTLAGGTKGNFPLVFDGAGNITFSTTPIAGSGAITKNGAGTVTLNFPNTNTGAWVINAGTVLYGVDNAIMTGAITVTGGTLDIATFSDMVGTVTLGTLDLASGTITGSTGVLSSGSFVVYQGTISAIIAGQAGTLAKSTTGTVVLTRPNLFTGATTVTAGILEIQDSMSLGLIDGITTVSAGATLQINGDGLSIPEYITFSGTGHLYTGAIRNMTGDNTLTGLLTLGAAAMIESDTGTTLTVDTKGISATTLGLTVGGLGNTTFTSTAPIYGTSASLTKNDAGTLTLQAFNNFTGATNFNGGEVVLNGAGAIPMSTTMTIGAGATLTLDNTSSSVVVDRLANSLALTMNGGNFNFIGSSSISTDETAGVLTSGIATQSGNNVITITPGSGGSTTMQFASLTRTAGSSLLFRGTSFGATPAAGVSTLLFTTAPTLTGGAGLENTTTISIIAGAFGDDSLSGTGTDMVTYGRGNSNGLRLLNGAGFSGEYSSTLATGANVKLATSTTAATTSINSLILSGSANITDAGTSQTITLATGNLLNLVADNTIAGANTTIDGSGVEIKIRDVGNLNISSLITTSGGLTKSGAGTLTFSTAKTYTGLTSVNQGTLLYGINDSISTGNVTVNGGILDIATYSDTVNDVILQNGTITGSTGILTGATYNFREGTVSAIIAGVAAVVTRIATNTSYDSIVTLTRDNTYGGATTITSGILKLGGAGGGTNTPLGVIGGATTVASSAALDLNGYTLGTAEPITISGLGYGPSASVAGGNSNMGALMNSGGSASYSGAITLGAAARINADAGAMTISGNASGNFALTFGGFSDITYSGVRSGTSTIVKDGIGVLTLSNGNSSYTGVTTISAGTVKLGAVSVGGTNSPLGTTAGGTTVATGSRLDLNGFSLGTAEPITSLNGVGYGLGDFASGAIMNSSGSAVTFTGLITLGAASTIKADYGDINLTAAGTITGGGLGLTLGGSGTGTLSSIIGTTTGTVTKIGTGTWTVSGQSTYTGATAVKLGTYKLGASGGATNTPLGTNAAGTTVYSGAVLDFNTYTIPTTEALTINGRGISDGGAIVGSSGTFGGTIAQATDSRISNASGTMTITGAVSGAFTLMVSGAGNITTSTAFGASALAITKQGDGTFTVTGANAYTGETRVEAGTFAYASTTTLAATNLVVKGGTFNSGANADTIGTVTLIDGIINNSAALTATTSYTLEKGTISGIIAGAIPVTKNTNNIVRWTGVNTISSTTTINAGILIITGSSGSAVSTTITVNYKGNLIIDNQVNVVNDRIGDALPITLNGGNFLFYGNSAGVSSETAGALTLASGHNFITILPGTGGSSAMTFASFSRTAGATGIFRGTNFGSPAGANVSTLIFTAAPTLTGAGGAEGTTTMSILKGAFGDSTNGLGSDMVTVVSNKLRPLASGEYSATLTTNTNVKLTGNTTASNVSINSLILNGYNITDAGSARTITISESGTLAGNILMNSATDIAGANTTLGITTNELDILATNFSTISATIGTATTGSVVLSGYGNPALNVTFSAANLYTSTTFINDVILTAGASNVISSGGVTMVGGTYDLNGNSDTIGAVSLNAGTITTGAGTLTLGGTLTTVANANVASTISGYLGLGANRDFNIADGLMDNDLKVSAVISGSFTLSKITSAGVMLVSGHNSYTGLTTVSAGTLRLGSAGGATNTPLGTTAAGTIVASGYSLDLNGYTLGTSEALTISGTGIGANGALLNTSSSAVTYSGLITLGAAATITSNYGDINISNTGNITGTGFTLTIGGAGNGSLASNLNTSTAGALTKNGLGVWTISGGASTFTGATTVSAGTLKLGSAGSGSNTPLGTSAGGISITSGATFDLNGYTLATAEALAINGTGIASTGGIGAFINTSNNALSYSGVITPGATSRLANYGTGLFTLSGNIVGSTRAITFVTVGDITQSSASVWSGTSTSLVKEGSGTLILEGQNSFTTGTVTVSTGVLRLGASGGATNTPLGTSGAGTTVALGAVLDLSTYNLGGASTYETLNLSGTGIKLGGALISSASSGTTYFGATTITANSIVTNSGAGTIRFNSTVTAAASINLWIKGTGPTIIGGVYGSASTATLTKDGAGTLTISAVATNTGLVRINGGTLAYGIADALSTSAVTVAGGTWDLAGYSEGGTTLIGAVTLIDGSIVNTGGAATITSSATYTVEKGTISAVLAGAAIAMAKNTGGTVTLSAANTFAGLTTINAGTLSWGINDALSSGSLTITGGFADLGTRTDTVATVTLTSGGITSSTGILTGTSYAFASGTVSAILAGAVNLSKTTAGTVTMSGTNTYSGTTTITAGTLRATSTTGLGDGSGTNTLIFAGGTLQAGGNISSPSARGITLTTTPIIDTNGYTVTLAGTVGSGAGLTKNGTGTLTISGAATLGGALAVNNGIFDQASSLNMTSGAVTVASSGVWSNIGTGAVTLSGTVTNSGTITLNSNNGAQCVDGANSILVRSSVNNTTRAWSSGSTGTGTFNMYNLDVDDMTGAGVTVYTSTLSGDTTWTVGSCANFSVAGTANGNNAATVKIAYNNSVQGQTGSIGGGTWSITGLTTPTSNDIITVWVDGVADALETTAITKWSSGNITGMVLNTGVLTVGSNQDTSLSFTNIDSYSCADDEDVMHSVISNVLNVEGQTCAGSVNNSYTDETLSVFDTFTIATTESMTTEKIENNGTITASGSPTITLTGTSGVLFSNWSTFTPATSEVVVTSASGTVDLLANGGGTTFHRLKINAGVTVNAGASITMSSADAANRLYVQAGGLADEGEQIIGTANGTFVMDSGTTLEISEAFISSAFPTNYTNGNITLNSNSTVNYNSTQAQTVSGVPTYGNLTISGAGTSTLGASTTVAGNLTVSGGTLDLSTLDFTVTGTSSITGTIEDSSSTGTNIFTGALTMNSGGVWTSTGNESYDFRGGLTINSGSTFTSGSGTYTFSTNAQTLGGTHSGVTITNVSNTISSSNGLTIEDGGITITNLTQDTNAVLTFSGTVPTVTTLTATANPNTVQYTSGSSQTIKGATYHHLSFTGSSTKSLGGNAIINGNMTMDSSSILSPTASYSFTGSGTNTFYANGSVNIYASTFTGSYNSFETVTPGASSYFYYLNGTQTIDPSISYAHVYLSGSGTTKTLGGATAVTGIFSVGSNVTLNPDSYTLTGTGGANTLDVTGTILVDGLNFSSSYSGFETKSLNAGSTVNYSRADVQNIDNTLSYIHLATSGSGIKTLLGNTTVTGNATIGASTTLDTTSSYSLAGSGTNTFTNNGTIRVQHSTFAGSYPSFETKTLTGGTVDYYLGGAQTVDSTLSYGGITISTSGLKTLDGVLSATGALSINGGTLSSGNHYTMNVGSVSIAGGTFTPGDATINLSGTGTVWSYTSGGHTASNENINITDSSVSAKTFAGGGETYNNVNFAGTGTGELIISGSNTFNELKITNPPHTIKFTAGTTQTLRYPKMSGISGSLNTLNSTAQDSTWTLYFNPISYGYVYEQEFLSLRDSTATGNSYFSEIYAASSTNTANNSGWTFSVRSRGGGAGGVEASAQPNPDQGGGGQGGGGCIESCDGGGQGQGGGGQGGGDDLGYTRWQNHFASAILSDFQALNLSKYLYKFLSFGFFVL